MPLRQLNTKSAKCLSDERNAEQVLLCGIFKHEHKNNPRRHKTLVRLAWQLLEKSPQVEVQGLYPHSSYRCLRKLFVCRQVNYLPIFEPKYHPELKVLRKNVALVPRTLII